MAASSTKRSRTSWFLLAFIGIVLAGVLVGTLWPRRTLESLAVLGGPLR